MVNFPPEQSLERYNERVEAATVRIEWFTREVIEQFNFGMERRVRLAAQLLRDKIVINISLPVERDNNGKVVVRSVAGEFPRTETGRLMKDIFFKKMGPRWYRVGTSLDYGLILETRLSRSFILRTFREMRDQIRRMLLRNQSGDPPVFVMEPL